MSVLQEWHALQVCLHSRDYGVGGFKNQFYRRLLLVLKDSNARVADKLLAFRDALMASPPMGVGLERYELQSDLTPDNVKVDPNVWGVKLDYRGRVSLYLDGMSEDSYASVYGLEKRRYIKKVMMDMALQRKLEDDKYVNYNGVAQQLAVRLAITEKPNSTIAISLPTGCGKTLVAHAVSLFADNSKLTIVVVPTTALAIEQGHRAKQLYVQSGDDHGGDYSWFGDMDKDVKDNIKERIRNRRQRMLFCSPEALQGALLPTVFRAAKENSLNAIFVDEAHMVDQWGAEFRPEFQIIGSLVQAFRKESKEGFKCILMSATFSDISLRLVEKLFTGRSKFYHINGVFLRPEIQFEVKKVSAQEHRNCVLRAAVKLPKPLIIYTLQVEDAESIHSTLSLDLGRVALFTGNTSNKDRERIIRTWNEDGIDVVVATSAFGLGMDKANVRSVLHAAVPETLDRFYQEVGRGGRDGNASQSSVIYHEEQLSDAKELANERLISIDLGLEKWFAMWRHGEVVDGGRRRIKVDSIRRDQRGPNDRNTQWNWQTLLLMQRADLIDLEFEPFESSWLGDESKVGEQGIPDYITNYYKSVLIEPLVHSHTSYSVWEEFLKPVRQQEKRISEENFQKLKLWLESPVEIRLCTLLSEHYTIDSYSPEYACGGCPSCLLESADPTTPTLGLSVYSNAETQKKFKAPIRSSDLARYIYFDISQRTHRRQIREWSHWLASLLENNVISAIRAERSVLKSLDIEIFRTSNRFWISNELESEQSGSDYWVELMVQLNDKHDLYEFNEITSPKILLAPSTVLDSKNRFRRWWESKPNSISLDSFLIEIS